MTAELVSVEAAHMFWVFLAFHFQHARLRLNRLGCEVRTWAVLSWWIVSMFQALCLEFLLTIMCWEFGLTEIKLRDVILLLLPTGLSGERDCRAPLKKKMLFASILPLQLHADTVQRLRHGWNSENCVFMDFMFFRLCNCTSWSWVIFNYVKPPPKQCFLTLSIAIQYCNTPNVLLEFTICHFGKCQPCTVHMYYDYSYYYLCHLFL